jgi:hypothetical protein
MRESDLTAWKSEVQWSDRLSPDMVTLNLKKFEGHIWSLSPQIQTNVIPSWPTAPLGAKSIALRLTDILIRQGTVI